jgi:hypothetical protein
MVAQNGGDGLPKVDCRTCPAHSGMIVSVRNFKWVTGIGVSVVVATLAVMGGGVASVRVGLDNIQASMNKIQITSGVQVALYETMIADLTAIALKQDNVRERLSPLEIEVKDLRHDSERTLRMIEKIVSP